MKNKTEMPVMVTIKNVKQEREDIFTFTFEHNLESRPGQFVMLWLPGVDAKPISIALDTGSEFVLTVCAIGDATKKICELKEGDQLGVFGPYGTFFNYKEGEHIALVGGGYGAAPMLFLADEARQKGCTVEFILGARSEDRLLYRDLVEKMDNVNLHVSTGDGSVGIQGHPTVILQEFTDKGGIDRIMTCGPEMMMQATGKIGDSAGINTQISVERYMKCGFGVCGQCVLDPMGIRTCVSGPVMNSKVLAMLDEFGQYHRDDLGKKHYFNKPAKK